MKFEDLTPEQQAKAQNCQTPEEMLALAQEEGYELGDEQLDAIAGGQFWDAPREGSGFSEPFQSTSGTNVTVEDASSPWFKA